MKQDAQRILIELIDTSLVNAKESLVLLNKQTEQWMILATKITEILESDSFKN